VQFPLVDRQHLFERVLAAQLDRFEQRVAEAGAERSVSNRY